MTIVQDQPIKVILVEDDHDLRHAVADYLRLSGLDVDDVPSGIAFYKALRTSTYDIAILDINLPDTSGFELARDLASERRTGIILLTARTGREDRIRGYGEGADIYLTKPVDGEELLLAVRNLSRRIRAATVPPANSTQGASPPAHWLLDQIHHHLVPPSGEPLPLSGREFLLLECLARASGATISRAEISRHLGYADHSVESRSLDAVMRRLRQKATESGLDLPLRAIHAVGIRFSAPLQLV